ncbi:MAG TPA: efflux RND transporter periplasmic adaptor subunit [Phycisphaerae bacterium]|nr:efflux RND transporter periplasmic adaptor subunit [Phycisphaerae bacterium]
MKKRTALFAVAAMAVAMAFPACSERSASERAEEKKPSPAGAEKERKVLYWKSKMNPSFIRKEPGKDPMGMDLVPVYEGEQPSGPAGTVRIDPATVQNIGVKTAVVRRKQLSREIRTVGRIAYDEGKVRHISPKIGGWVERQSVNFAGQVVDKGERLLEIYSPELVATQEEYLITLQYHARLKDSTVGNAAAGSESLLRAAETRLRYWDISEEQIRALRERGQITRTMELHAPFKGIILQKDVLEGGHVQTGKNLYSIADISTVWVFADIYEYEAPWLRLGQEAAMTLSYRPGATYRGKVAYIYPYLKSMTRTLQVRMEFKNTEDFDLKPDMWANVTIRPSLGRKSLAVPVQAVIRTGKRDVVLIALEGGRFAPREVRLGAEAGDEFEVLDGLQEGERVVTSAQFLINSESNLQSAIGKMLAPEAPEEGAGKAPPPAASPAKEMPETGAAGTSPAQRRKGKE